MSKIILTVLTYIVYAVSTFSWIFLTSGFGIYNPLFYILLLAVVFHTTLLVRGGISTQKAVYFFVGAVIYSVLIYFWSFGFPILPYDEIPVVE